MLVDPDRAIRTPIAHLLSDRHALYEAEDGLMALTLATMIPDLALVLSAVSLPTIDGVDLVRLFKSRESLWHVPFVFLCPRVSVNDHHRLLFAGARKCLHRELPPHKIVAAAEKILGPSTRTPMRRARPA